MESPLPVPYLRCLKKRMSLKAKLEAVIYAAEEPVTLAQLASLFAEDALAWKAEEDARAAESARLALAVNDPHTYPDAPHILTDSTQEIADLLAVVDEARTEGAVEEIARAEDTEPGDAAVAAPAETEAAGVTIDPVVDAAAEAKRAERKREREIRDILRRILDELIAEYAREDRGIEIREIAGGFRMSTKPEIHDAVRSFVKSLKPPMKLSLPALETLAVIAYKQPVTAPEVGEIRGVDSAGVLGSLMSRKLISTAGRKQVIGRPMLYKTTKEFLLRFGLKDLTELPSMEEFEKLAAMELNEESIDSESGEAEPVEHSGDLFAGAEETTPDSANAPEDNSEQLASKGHIETETTIPAHPSPEAAEAQALVERQNAEEIEVSQ